MCCERVPLLKNRNAYIKLLLKSIQELGRLEGIFKKLPPHDSQELQNIQKHQILEIEFAIKAKGVTNNIKNRTKSTNRSFIERSLSSNRASNHQNTIESNPHATIDSNNRSRKFSPPLNRTVDASEQNTNEKLVSILQHSFKPLDRHEVNESAEQSKELRFKLSPEQAVEEDETSIESQAQFE